MSSPIQMLVAELSHEINSPLAAIRSALYLASCRSADAEVRRYLQIADEEVARVARVLQTSRKTHGVSFEKRRYQSKAA